MQGYKYLKKIIVQAFTDNSIRWSFIGAGCFLFIGVLASLSLPFLLKNLVESLAVDNERIFLPWILLSYGLIWMISLATQNIRAFLTHRIEQRVIFLLGSKILSHLYSLSHQYFINQKPGAVTNIIRRAQRHVPSIIIGLFLHVVPTLLEFMLAVFSILFFYPVFYVLILTFILLSFFAYTFLSVPSILHLREQANHIDREVDGVITDWISNYDAIRTFSKRDFAVKLCDTELKKRETVEIEFEKQCLWTRLGQSLILGIGLSALTYFIGRGVREGSLTIGDFVLFNGYVMQFIVPISILGNVIQDIKKALIDMKGVLSILSTSSEIQEIRNPIKLRGSLFSIEFRNVSFCYDDRCILNNYSFRIEAGQTALIMGKTGIGKSTIAKLLLRLYDPTEGEILINNINIKYLELESLYEIVGWVPQETYLLNDTIMNNIGFVRPNSSCEEIMAALEKSHLNSLIQKLPYGLKSIVGDRGVKLSGGEKQRLAIARLFLKNPGICIFDESTASLDKKTDTAIQRNIARYLPNATKIIITHRPYLIGKVDQIIELNHSGSIAKITSTLRKRV